MGETDHLPDHGEYNGLRVTAAFHIGDTPPSSKIRKLPRVHLDIACGDTLNEGRQVKTLRSILPDFQPISWSVYPLEYILAEKLQTLVTRGSLNSRAKDYYDLLVVFEQIPVDTRLAKIVEEVFIHRRTEVPPSFVGYVARLDHRILRQAWASVGVAPEISFDECLAGLLQHLRRLDLVISRKR